MATSNPRTLAKTLLDRFGQTYAEELRIPIEKNTPAPLFQLLCAAMLYSARIPARNATTAIRALIDAGLTTPKKMVEASWQDRVDVITWHGYKRYDESAARMLGETAQLVLDRYHGDLRRLRQEADRDVDLEKKLLQQFKGIGNVGADIFLREVQLAWDEVYPYADAKVLRAAKRLELADDVQALARLTSRRRFPRLVAALVRTDLAHAYDEIRQAA